MEALIESVTGTVFHYISSGLFERHKLIVASQLTMSVLKKRGMLPAQQFDWLLRGPRVAGVDNPVPEWVGSGNWESVQSLR